MSSRSSRRQPKWWKEIVAAWQEKVVDVEEAFDERWRELAHRLGLDRPRYIQTFRGVATHDEARFSGRLLANRPPRAPQDDDSWWDNLGATFRRWESDELPGRAVEVELAGRKVPATTDEEGYFHLALPLEQPLATPWQSYTVRAATGDEDEETVEGTGRIYTPPSSAEIAVVSDVDDTVLFSGVTEILTLAKLTFLGNSLTRVPLPGVGALYRGFRDGPAGEQGNPVFYVSSSPWNLYELLRDFLAAQDLPEGPLLLQDLGLDDEKLIQSAGHRHKLEKTEDLLGLYPYLGFVLIGDSGQADAELYLEAAQRYGPERIRAIYIRDVDPERDSDNDAKVDRAVRASQEAGVPMVRVQDSIELARHAAELGLLAPAVAAEVEAAS